MRPLSVESIWQETRAGFDWLAEGLDATTPVALIPNPGNIGDALINLSCHRYLRSRFRTVSIASPGKSPHAEHVFVAGGGNLVQPLYSALADRLAALSGDHKLYLFPSTIVGNETLLRGLRGRVRILCRERVTFAHVCAHLSATEVRLGHDAAFALSDRLKAAFAGAIDEHPVAAARLFRLDKERRLSEGGDRDLMGEASGDWTDIATAERAVLSAAAEILQYGRIHTDRLHCAIMAAILNRYVILRPNSYFKNQAVFDYSLSGFANVRFEAEVLDSLVAT
jgi:exopolysaccharide biosynthesis predicted pyruvyltransferase EpsI